MCACGEVIGDGAQPGYPRYCSPQCRRDYGGPESPVNAELTPAGKKPRTHNCPVEGCERRFRTHEGAAQHYRDSHNPDKPPPNSLADLGLG